MRLVSRIAIALSTLLEKKRVDGQLDDELRGYVEMVTDEKIAAGVSAAMLAGARWLELGGMEQVKQTIRDHRAGTDFEVIVAGRALRMAATVAQPGFHGGCGCYAGAFDWREYGHLFDCECADAEESSVSEPERIGTIFWRIDGARPFDGLNDIDGEQWELLRDDGSVGDGGGGERDPRRGESSAGRSVQYVHAGRVSAHYFDVLGIRPHGEKLSRRTRIDRTDQMP